MARGLPLNSLGVERDRCSKKLGFAGVRPGRPMTRRNAEEARLIRKCSLANRSGRWPTILKQLSGAGEKPAVIGHSFGGLLTQILAGRGLAAVSVAIDPAQFRIVLPLPISASSVHFLVLSNQLTTGRFPSTYALSSGTSFACNVRAKRKKAVQRAGRCPPPANHCSKRRRPT